MNKELYTILLKIFFYVFGNFEKCYSHKVPSSTLILRRQNSIISDYIHKNMITLLKTARSSLRHLYSINNNGESIGHLHLRHTSSIIVHLFLLKRNHPIVFSLHEISFHPLSGNGFKVIFELSLLKIGDNCYVLTLKTFIYKVYWQLAIHLIRPRMHYLDSLEVKQNGEQRSIRKTGRKTRSEIKPMKSKDKKRRSKR